MSKHPVMLSQSC